MYIDKHPGILCAYIHQKINLWEQQSGARISHWILGLFWTLVHFSVIKRKRKQNKQWGIHLSLLLHHFSATSFWVSFHCSLINITSSLGVSNLSPVWIHLLLHSWPPSVPSLSYAKLSVLPMAPWGSHAASGLCACAEALCSPWISFSLSSPPWSPASEGCCLSSQQVIRFSSVGFLRPLW